jgi:hypothetical protein
MENMYFINYSFFFFHRRAQSSIYHFTKGPNNSCIRDLPSNLINTAYDDLNISNNYEQVPMQVSNDIEENIKVNHKAIKVISVKNIYAGTYLFVRNRC